jgi:hypothetical protein
LNLSKGQKELHPGPNCPFEAVKKTKRAASGNEMSF